MWSPAADRLFFRSTGEATRTILFAADISTSSSVTRTSLEPLELLLASDQDSRDYDITPEGDRFLVVMPAVSGTETDRSESGGVFPPTIHVVLNWFEELTDRVPVP